jgi:hypothetical protein
VIVLGDLWLFLDVTLKLRLSVFAEQPPEHGLLNLLVVFILEELISEEFHRAHHKQLTAALTLVKGRNWPIGRKTNGPTREDRVRGLPHIKRGAERVDKFHAAVLVPLRKVILRVAIPFGVFALLHLALLCFALSDAHELLIEAAIADKGFFGVQIFVETLSNDRIVVHVDSKLFQHCIDVGVGFLLATLLHDNEDGAAIFDVVANILELLAREWHAGTTQQNEMALAHALRGQICLVNIALQTV